MDVPIERRAKLDGILAAGEVNATFSVARARLRRAMADPEQIEALAQRDKNP